MRSTYLFSLKQPQCRTKLGLRCVIKDASEKGGCFIDLPSYLPLRRAMRAPVPAAFHFHHLAFRHCLFSTVLTDILFTYLFYNNFLDSFLPIISSRLTALSRQPFQLDKRLYLPSHRYSGPIEVRY